MKILHRIMLPLVVAMLFIASATAALAQGSRTWMPAFDPDTHVYLDSRLENHRDYPVSFPQLRSQIEQAEKVHGLKIFIVATEQGSESSPSNTLAGTKLDELLLRWQNEPGFPKDDYLLIVWVRFKDDPLHGSVAANGGSRLRGYGMDGAHFSSSGGPVIPVLKRYMRDNPELALSTILDNVNAEVTSAIEAEKDAAERAEFMKELPGILFKWFLILAAVGLVIGILVRFFRARSRAKRLMNRLENGLAEATQFEQELKKKHGKFLTARRDWETRFTGTSKEKLTAGLTAYSELLSLCAGGSKRLVEVKRAFSSHWFPRVKGYREVVRLLEDVDIIVSSKEIALEMASLFGGLTVNKVVSPASVFNQSSTLNQTAESNLSEVEAALAVIEQTVDTVNGVITWARDQKSALEAQQLTLKPYEPAIAHVVCELDDFIKTAAPDPVTVMLEAPALVDTAKRMGGTIERALELAGDIDEVSETVSQTVARARQVREDAVDYRFPGGEARTLTQRYQLEEQNGDPDPLVNEAAGKLMLAQDRLAEGKLELTWAAIEVARTKRAEAEALIDRVFAAKKQVEDEAGLVDGRQLELSTAIASAKDALSSLESEFIAANYAEARKAYEAAVAFYGSRRETFERVRRAYDRQLYLTAGKLLTEIFATIDGGKTDCKALEDRLTLLTTYRTDSRTFVRESRQHATRLRSLIAERSFTTSAATDRQYAEAVTEVGHLEAIVPKSIADWVDAHTRASAVKQSLATVETDCDSQLALYEETFALVGSLPADVESAHLSIIERTLKPARDAHAGAASAMEVLAKAVDVPKSDWQSLKEQAEKAHQLCQSCRDLAARDEAQYQSAALHLAYCKVRARRFSRRKHKFLAEGNRLYALAQATFKRREWQEACQQSVAAYKEFLKFDRMQKRRTATMVVKGAPGHATSVPATASGSTTASDDGFSMGVAIAIGMHLGNSQPSGGSSGSSSSSSTYSSPSSSPSYSSSSSSTSYSSPSVSVSVSSGTGGGGY